MSGNGGRWSDIMEAPDPGELKHAWAKLQPSWWWVTETPGADEEGDE